MRESRHELYENCIKYARKVFEDGELRVGEHVSFRILRIDQSCTDLLPLPCIIVEVVGKAQSLHCLRCKSGVIQRCYQAGDLEPYRGQYGIPLDGWENEPRICFKEKKSGTLEFVHRQ